MFTAVAVPSHVLCRLSFLTTANNPALHRPAGESLVVDSPIHLRHTNWHEATVHVHLVNQQKRNRHANLRVFVFMLSLDFTRVLRLTPDQKRVEVWGDRRPYHGKFHRLAVVATGRCRLTV